MPTSVKLKITKPNLQLTEPIKFFIAIGAGTSMGFLGLSNGIVAVLYFALSLLPVFFAFQNKLEKVLTAVPYFVYAEIYFRANGNILPYLFCPYILIATFILLLARKGIVFKIASRAFVFLFLFAVLEIFNAFRTENPNVARSSITYTIFLFLITLWASSTVMTSRQINIFLKNFKIAGLWLCGYILTAHLTGNIKYATASNFESTNGLAPVQISAYLGFLSFLFFLSIANKTEPGKIIFNIFFLFLSSTLMVLSFSRGGVYFLGILIGMYFLFNAKNMSNYFMLLLIIPVGALVYYLVGETTGGLISDRYAEQGSSGRDVLVKIGIELFLKNPVAGIGTGNFNTEIVKNELYSMQSGAHNEFIRVIAEHGFLGICTYWMFYVALFFEIFKARGIKREYALYFFVLFILIIIHNGLKIALQPMILLLVVALPHSGKIVKAKPNNNPGT